MLHLLVHLVFFLLFHAGTGHAFAPRVRKIVPPIGTYIGAAVDYPSLNYSVAGVPQSMGFQPASYVMFIQLPLRSDDIWMMDQILPQICKRGIALILTPEPYQGLDAVSDKDITKIVDFIVKY